MDEWTIKSHGMDLEEEFYSFDFDAGELSGYQDHAELLVALKQKEEEVILAAQLGNALLLENRQLKEESDKLHERYTDKLEDLEQGRHELQMKLASCQMERDTRVADLEREVQELSSQVEWLTQTLTKAEQDKTQAQAEHKEQTWQLREQLENATVVEQVLQTKLQALKQELQEKDSGRFHDEELLSAMKEQVSLLTQKEQALEHRLEAECQKNEELQENLVTLNARLSLEEQCAQRQSQQLAEAQREAEAACRKSRQLQAQVDELREEMSRLEPQEASLLSELQTSMEGEGWSLEKERVTQELLSILTMLLPLTEQGRRPDRGHLGQDDGLLGTLLHLKSVARELTYGGKLQDMNPSAVTMESKSGENPGTAQDPLAQNDQLKEENAELRWRIGSSQELELVQQAIHDRDDAIAKKNAIEEELIRSKNDLMSLNNQLLEAIQRKLELSQELEAWQDDIQVILNQQLRYQQQTEQSQRKASVNRLAFLRRPSTPASRPRRPSFPFSFTSESVPERTQVAWSDWLKRGKTG